MANLNQAPHDDDKSTDGLGLFEHLPKTPVGIIGGLGNLAIGAVFEGVRGVNRTVRSLGSKAIIALEIVLEGILRADHPELYPDDEPTDSN
jgi:hypothetical protein